MSVPAPRTRITDKQRQIMTMYGDGKTASEIARTLGCTVQNVSQHLQRYNRNIVSADLTKEDAFVTGI